MASLDEILKCGLSNGGVVVVPCFDSLDEILKCDYSNKSW